MSPQGIMTKKREIDEKISANHKKVDQLDDEIAGLQSQNKDLSVKIEEYKETCKW